MISVLFTAVGATTGNLTGMVLPSSTKPTSNSTARKFCSSMTIPLSRISSSVSGREVTRETSTSSKIVHRHRRRRTFEQRRAARAIDEPNAIELKIADEIQRRQQETVRLASPTSRRAGNDGPRNVASRNDPAGAATLPVSFAEIEPAIPFGTESTAGVTFSDVPTTL